MSTPSRPLGSRPLPTLRILAMLLVLWPLGLAAQEGVDLRPSGDPTVAAKSRVADGDAPKLASPPQRPRFRISDDPGTVVIEFRELDRPAPEGAERPHRWRIYCDGRLETWPEPEEPRDPPYRLDPDALEALLRTLVALNDLPSHQTTDPPPGDRSYLRVQLDRFHTDDWSVAIDYLDAVLVEDLAADFESPSRAALRASFRELSAVRQWLAWSHPGVVWISGNPHPSICSPGDRLGLGLPDEQPPWCAYFRSRPGVAMFPDGDPARREEIRERLRKRLRALPRGLQEEDSQ